MSDATALATLIFACWHRNVVRCYRNERYWRWVQRKTIEAEGNGEELYSSRMKAQNPRSYEGCLLEPLPGPD
jgi:hypothetical protein